MTADAMSGVWTYSLELARALAPYDYHITLATMGRPLTLEQRADAASIRNLEVVESAYRLESEADAWADVDQAGKWLLGIARVCRPDVVHLGGYAHAALPWSRPVVVVGHSCVLSWWRAAKGGEAPPEWDLYRERVKAGLQAADYVVAPSSAMLNDLQRSYGPFTRARAIPNGRDLLLFRPVRKEPIVFAAGRLNDEARNIRELYDVADDITWPVRIAGSASDPDGGSTTSTGDRCLGNLPPRDVARWLSRAAIYALPARYEPLGLSVLEAAMSGCALVLGNIPSLREVWGDAALWITPGSGGLATAVQRLIDDPDLRATMVSRATERARFYTPQRMARAYLRLYRELDVARDRHYVGRTYIPPYPVAPAG